MSRYTGPRLKVLRALGVDLPGLTRKSMQDRPNPPGQHGARKVQARKSEFGLQLMEKQKLRYHYGLTERQLRRAVADALDTREALLNDAAQPDVSIRPLNDDERPWLLFYTDVAPGPDMWGLTPYFGKQSVTISDFE